MLIVHVNQNSYGSGPDFASIKRRKAIKSEINGNVTFTTEKQILVRL